MRTLIVVLLVVLTLVGTASQHSVAQEATSPTLVTIQSAQPSDLRQLLPKEYPPVPDWLVALPPSEMESAVALPNGNWVVQTVDYYPLDDPSFPGQGYEEWYLYDSTGNRIANPNTAHGTGWEDRVWPNGFYDTVWESPYYTADPVDYSSNQIGAGGYVFLFDRNDPTAPILAAYDDSNGQLLFDRSKDKECVLPVRQFHYCQRIDRQKLLNLAK